MNHVWLNGVHYPTLIDAHRFIEGATRSVAHELPDGWSDVFKVYADPFGDRLVASIEVQTYWEHPCCEECGPAENHCYSQITNYR